MQHWTNKKRNTPSASEGAFVNSCLKTWSQSAQLGTRLHHGCDVAVQELNKELTILHSVKLIKVMLQGARALPGALLHTVCSTGLITC